MTHTEPSFHEPTLFVTLYIYSSVEQKKKKQYRFIMNSPNACIPPFLPRIGEHIRVGDGLLIKVTEVHHLLPSISVSARYDYDVHAEIFEEKSDELYSDLIAEQWQVQDEMDEQDWLVMTS